MAIKCPKCHSENPDTSRFCGSCAAALNADFQAVPSVTKTLATPAHGQAKATTVAGKYRIIEEIGRGGMGIVYKAEDTKLHRAVALKFLPEDLAHDHQAVERFQREARAASALNHPHICTIYDIDEHEGEHFIALEFLEGKTLREYLLGKHLDVDQIVDLGIQVAGGLEAAHAKGIIHRDIKPGNIFVTDSGQAKILDFGLAKLLPKWRPKSEVKVVEGMPTMTAEELLTSPGSAVGTVAYMSPEQALGKDLDARTDLFSLGVMIYEMATGIPPFRGDTSAAIFDEILHEVPAAPVRLNPKVPVELERIINKALEKDREVRYQSAKEIVVDLKRLKRDTESGKVATRASIPRTKSWFQKPIAKYTLAAGTLLVVALVIYQVWKPGGKAQIPSLGQPTHKQITFVGHAFFPGLSPDGKSVTYVISEVGKELRLMLQDLSGGQPIELARANSVGFQKWSPDGSELIILKQNADRSSGIALIPRLGGASRIIAPGDWACWSPDGTHIATTSVSEKAFRIVDKSTGDTKNIPLKGIPFTWISLLDWSGASNLLAILSIMENGRSAVLTVRPDGSQLRKVLEEEAISSICWSSAGDAIYFLRTKNGSQELAKLSINPKTGEAKREPSVLLTGLQAGDYFTISGNGTRLAYTRTQGYSNLWLGEWPGPGKDRKPQLKPLTTGTSTFDWPSMSPDGQWIAYAGGSPPEIYKMPVGGGTPTQLTFSNAYHGPPAWSPDGKRIAFGIQEGTACRVWIMNSDGGNQHPLTKTKISNSLMVSWSPGHDILYQRPGNRNFSVLDPETEQEKTLVKDESAGYIFSPIYSPDRKKVAVYWNRDQPGLWVISLANNETKLLGRYYPKGWSPDGKWIYGSNLSNQAVCAAVPVAGGEPETIANLPEEGGIWCVSRDGRKFVWAKYEMLSDVWVVDNFDPQRK